MESWKSSHSVLYRALSPVGATALLSPENKGRTHLKTKVQQGKGTADHLIAFWEVAQKGMSYRMQGIFYCPSAHPSALSLSQGA